jgi:hypothetical protein
MNILETAIQVVRGAYFGSFNIREAVAEWVKEIHKPFQESGELDGLFHAFRVEQGALDEF